MLLELFLFNPLKMESQSMKQNQKALENISKTDTPKLTNRESLNCPIV
jgi:hypothetical protein